ncbi:MAG TPA: TIGR00303 family protein [Chloroflexia bacterium]|nr:TIGR00303 family protein [Chloroflexia bacterium]
MWELDRDILRVFRPVESEAFIYLVRNRQPLFALTVAYTGTVQLPGVSGAGINAEMRELTAPADAEIMAHGRARCLPNGVPSNPTGAPGPSIITRAAFDLLPAMPFICVDAGLKIKADVPDLFTLEGAGPALPLDSGKALGKNEDRALQLFLSGWEAGERLGRKQAKEGYLILAESVPGGTTTALGLLLALGLDAEQRVSSSMPENAHGLKLQAALGGLKAAGGAKGSFAERPLMAVAAVGDPMQPAVTGMALAASAYCPVVLGGGTQMAAVVALLAALRRYPPAGLQEKLQKARPENIALVTTRWVSADPTADLAGLGAEIEQRFGIQSIPYLSANLDFSYASYPPMRLYEEGYVKEGVGAGAAAFAAMLALEQSAAELLPHIERVYRRIVLNENNNE